MDHLLEYIAIAFSISALFIAVVALLTARKSHGVEKTSHHVVKKSSQEYESVPRLQIIDEKIFPGNPSAPGKTAFSYKAKVLNKGTKTVNISAIHLDYGDDSDPSQRMKFFVDGQMFLNPKQTYEFVKAITWSDVEEMKKNYDFNSCTFFLRITYVTPSGDMNDSTHALYGFDGLRPIFHARTEENLT